MPLVARKVTTGVAVPEKLAQVEVMFPQIVPRNCRLSPPYRKIAKIQSYKVTGAAILYASPDSTFAVTKRLFDAAKKSILIGIYDFTSQHVKQLVLQALGRKVQVSLMLDIDSKEEQQLYDDMVTMGVRGVPAPSCASQHNHKVFRSSHEKVIVIDDEIILVQSGNYSDNSCPFNIKDGGDPKAFAPGNRDMGIALRSPELAAFFTSILRSDMRLELTGAQALAVPPVLEPQAVLVERAPTKTPSTLYPSKTVTLTGPLQVQPVLSPDNYMDVVPTALRGAKRSILIEQQYIHALDAHITDLVKAIALAEKGGRKLDIRIVLGKLFGAKDVPKVKASLKELEKQCGLKLGRNVRFINEQRLVHCHNKMILVDGKTVLISSQNWSSAAVWENREAGLLFNHNAIANYYTAIFETDWKDGVSKIPVPKGKPLATPQALQRGGFIKVSPADYAEV